MRAFRNFLYFFVGVLLGSLAVVANAETQSTGYVTGYGVLGGQPYAVTVTSCAALSGQCAGGACTVADPYPSNPGLIACMKGTNMITSLNRYIGCPVGQNWTQSGNTCTRPDCVAPQTRDPADGVCKAPPCPAAGQSGASLGATGVFAGTGQMPNTLCINSCVYDRGGVGVQAGSGWATGVGSATGASCSQSTGAALPASDPTTDPKTKCVESGQSYGTVNGVVVCVPASTVTTKSGSTTTTTNKDPQGNVTSTTTSSSTTTSTTTNVSGGGGGKSTTTTTTNPDGSTTTTTTDQTGAGDGDDEGDDDWGTPPEEGALTEQAVGPSSITPVSIGGSGSCPAPIALPHNWGSMSYEPACNLAGMIKPITLVFAWLAALLIAVGGFKDA